MNDVVKHRPDTDSISRKTSSDPLPEQAGDTHAPVQQDDPEPQRTGSESHSQVRLYVGFGFLGIALVFLMTLVIVSMFTPTAVIGHTQKALVVSIMAISMAAGVAALGGHAVASGMVDLPFIKSRETVFELAGGIVVFSVVMLLGQNLFLKETQ